MIMHKWVTPTRYYQLDASQDLFGVWIITRTWKGRFSKKGNSKTISVDNINHVELFISRIHKQRIKRGYTLLEYAPCPATINI